MATRPAICVDVDNVVAETDVVLRRVIKLYSRASVDLRYEDVIEFEYWRCSDAAGRRLEKDEWPHIHREFTLKHLMEIEAIAGARASLERLGRVFEVHLATSRLPEGRESTLAWLRQRDIPYSRIHFVSHREKHEIGQGFTAAVEDDREQAKLFQARGVQAFLLAHPWNVPRSMDDLARFDDWAGLANALNRSSV